MCHCSKDAAKNHPFKPHGTGVFQAVFLQRHAPFPVAPSFLCVFSRSLWPFLLMSSKAVERRVRIARPGLGRSVDVPLLERRRQKSSIQTARHRRLSSSVSPAPRSIACRPTLFCAFSLLCGYSSSCLPKRSRGASASRPDLGWSALAMAQCWPMCHCSKDAAKNHPFKPHGAGVFQAVFPQRHDQFPVASHAPFAVSHTPFPTPPPGGLVAVLKRSNSSGIITRPPRPPPFFGIHHSSLPIASPQPPYAVCRPLRIV
jgi:hypothetical protein